MFGRFSRGKPSGVEKVEPSLANGDAGTGDNRHLSPQQIDASVDGIQFVNSLSDIEEINYREADEFIATKVDIHRFLLDKINLSMIERIDKKELADQIRNFVKDYIREKSYPLNAPEIDNSEPQGPHQNPTAN